MHEAAARVRRDHFAEPPAAALQLAAARERGFPEDLLTFYSLTDGCCLWPGSDITTPDGRQWRYLMPPLSCLRTIPECGYLLPGAGTLYDEAQSWLALFDVGDGNQLALDVSPNHRGQVIDCWVETINRPGELSVVALSFSEAIEHFLTSREAWWLHSGRQHYGTR